MTHSIGRTLAAALLLACVGCGSEDETPAGEPLPIPEGCNPLAADWDCLLPYPSDHFLVDAGGGSQKVQLTEAAQLATVDGLRFDPLALHPADGWSFGQQILALFPGGVRPDELFGYYDDPERSLGDDSPTLLIDAETGERVVHFSELDPRAQTDDRRALFVRPIVRLQGARRYVVALRKLFDPSGAPLTPPEGFRRIRDRETRGDPVLGPLAARYESELFPLLETAGVPRDELLLAWDFTVRSEDNAAGDMLAVRSDVIQRLSSQPPEIQIVSVQDAVDDHVFRRIEATVSVPLYVDSAEPLARLARDGSGNVVAAGTHQVPFTVWIPKSVGERPAGTPAARLLQFGHGFFGSREEAAGYPAELADERGFVVVAADWWGMSDDDRIKVIEVLLADPGQMLVFTDRVHQAMANFMYVAAAAKGPLATLPELQVPAGPAYDPSALYFYGISQGHILGGTYTALAPEVERATLSVGGADLSLMLFRSRPFLPFLFFIEQKVDDPLDQQKLGAMLQSSFDRIDPLTYAPRIVTDPLPDGPSKKQLLLQIGIGDAAVPNVASHLHARALGIPELAPEPRALPALSAEPGPLASALVELDFGISPWPDRRALPADQDNPVHESVRRLDAAKEQIDRFFRPGGMVEATCDGTCDPE